MFNHQYDNYNENTVNNILTSLSFRRSIINYVWKMLKNVSQATFWEQNFVCLIVFDMFRSNVAGLSNLSVWIKEII